MKAASVPILFLHFGHSPILTWSLFQARTSNPSAPVLLLGDRSNRGVAKHFEHHQVSDYFSGATEFSSVYSHMSSNPYQYELFCFQRWFILRDFMRAHGLSRCVAIDTDVMTYSELGALSQKYRLADLAMRGWGAHLAFVNSAEAVDRFCSYCLALYREPNHQARLAENFARFSPGLGGNCDMTAFDWYRQEFPDRVTDIGGIDDDATYDQAVSGSDGFEMENGRKKITWQNDIPYGYHAELDRLIRFHILHFQGTTKDDMRNFYRGPAIPRNFRIEPARVRFARRTRAAVRSAFSLLSPPDRKNRRLSAAPCDSAKQKPKSS